MILDEEITSVEPKPREIRENLKDCPPMKT